MTQLETLMQAKAARDVVRDQLLKRVREMRLDDAEVVGLLRADELATADLSVAVAVSIEEQINDSTSRSQHDERQAA